MDAPGALAVFRRRARHGPRDRPRRRPLLVRRPARPLLGRSCERARGRVHDRRQRSPLLHGRARDPEGLAISLVLIPRGVRILYAAGWSIFSSLPQPLVAVPAFLFVAFFEGLVAVGLGFAGGAMLWMVTAQVVPDALSTSSRRSVALALGASTGAMLALEALLLA